MWTGPEDFRLAIFLSDTTIDEKVGVSKDLIGAQITCIRVDYFHVSCIVFGESPANGSKLEQRQCWVQS